MWNFPLLPQEASTMSRHVDALMIYVFSIAVFFSLLIAGLIIYFAVKYHHRAQADRSNPVYSNVPLEIVWTAVPILLTATMFFWGAELFVRMHDAPPDSMEIYVVGKQWMWKIQHPEGPREINELHVPVGRPIKLLMTSQDVIHSFFVPDFRMKQDVLPGHFTSQWFEAVTPGRYRLFCSQYCGTSHSAMVGWIVVMTPVDYEHWLEGAESGSTAGAASADVSMADQGGRLFNRLACASCHKPAGQGRGPSLVGLFGNKVALEGGKTATADEEYLRESILKPNAKIAKGYQPLMPTFQGQVDEVQLEQLIAYLKSLKKRS
jgi:cytochrome c oxidase subunit 2